LKKGFDERLTPLKKDIEIIAHKSKPLMWLDEFALTKRDLNERVNYLIDDFLVEQTITNIYSKAGQGKSFLALYLALMLLDENKINECYYIEIASKIFCKFFINFTIMFQIFPRNIFFTHPFGIGVHC